MAGSLLYSIRKGMTSMKIVVRALVRWSWVLLLCLVVGLLGGKKLATFFPPQYQATALIQLNMQSNTSAIVQPVAAYASLATSDSVLGAALKKYPDLDLQTMSTKQLTITNDPKSQTVSIQVALPHAIEAASLANDLAHLLVAQQNAYIQQQYTNELKLLDGRIANEQKNINTLNQQIIQLSANAAANGTAIQQAQNQVSQNQNLQNQDVSQQQALLTQQALDSNPLSVVQGAIPPSKPSSIIGLVPFAPAFLGLMLLLGMVVLFLLERGADRINGVFALQQQLGLPVLGSLRWTSPSPDTIPLRSLIESKELYAEDCRIMMADILVNAEQAGARIVTITGTRVRSGSSTIASELAALLAQSKRSVLLIGANMPGRVQPRRFGIPIDGGLASMLEAASHMKIDFLTALTQEPREGRRQQPAMATAETQGNVGAPNHSPIKLDPLLMNSPRRTMNGASAKMAVTVAENFPFGRYIVSTSVQNLHVLPAGRSRLNPSYLLSMPLMDFFLRWASRRVDFIVIDSPPLMYADSHVLGSLSDQTFLVVDATKDRQKQVLNAKQEFLTTGVKLSGIIVNKLGRWV